MTCRAEAFLRVLADAPELKFCSRNQVCTLQRTSPQKEPQSVLTQAVQALQLFFAPQKLTHAWTVVQKPLDHAPPHAPTFLKNCELFFRIAAYSLYDFPARTLPERKLSLNSKGSDCRPGSSLPCSTCADIVHPNKEYFMLRVL